MVFVFFSFFFLTPNLILALRYFFLYTGTGSFRPIQTRLAPSSRLPLSKASPATSSSSATATQLSSVYCFYWLIYFCVFPWQLCYPFCAVIKGPHRYSLFYTHVASAPCSLNYWTFHCNILSASVSRWCLSDVTNPSCSSSVNPVSGAIDLAAKSAGIIPGSPCRELTSSSVDNKMVIASSPATEDEPDADLLQQSVPEVGGTCIFIIIVDLGLLVLWGYIF